MRTRRTIVWAGVLTPVVLLLAIVAAWAIDTGAAGGEVLRNVDLAGEDIGGLGSDDLLDRIDRLSTTIDDWPVRIVTPEATYDTAATEIGLSVDAVSTAESALDEGRSAVLPARPVGWLMSFFRSYDAPLHFTVDRDVARSTIRELEGETRLSPVEPTIESLDGDPFVAVPGSAGLGIDPQTLATALAAAATDTPIGEPIDVEIRPAALSPRLADSAAEAAAARANSMTDTTLSVTAADRTIQLVPRELRRMMQVRELEDRIAFSLDEEALMSLLEEEFAPLTVEPVEASITLVDGTPVVTPSVTGLACCAPETAEAVQTAFQSGASEVTVELTETEPDLTTEDAEALGIVEEVGSPDAFGPTTQHRCCQNRVQNIHRIADIVRGAVIRPGETFSVNDFVGQRTREKGFVSDGVIYNGVLTQDVGGGVSQFATTLFNAALYAGLELAEYQSHSLYISRYPRGHEATISFPAPDLKIRNDSRYGVMIWPTYTDTSLTVHLYSTRHIDVVVGEPSSSRAGNCTRWTTPRTRGYPDGTVDRDTVSALYRPAEGVNC